MKEKNETRERMIKAMNKTMKDFEEMEKLENEKLENEYPLIYQINYKNLSTPLKVFVWLGWLTIIMNVGFFALGMIIGVVEVMLGG